MADSEKQPLLNLYSKLVYKRPTKFTNQDFMQIVYIFLYTLATNYLTDYEVAVSLLVSGEVKFVGAGGIQEFS